LPPGDGITDASGARWTVTDGVVRRNNVDTISSNVKLLLYSGGAVYQSNAAGGWWKWNADKWEGATDPRAGPPPTSAPPPVAPSGSVPTVANMARHPADMLEIDGYWIIDNRWGRRGIDEGTQAHQFMQEVERSLTVSNGGVAARIKWRWPEFNQAGEKINDNSAYSEVKCYPAIIYGAMPGHYNTQQWPAWEYVVRAPDGKTVPTAPSGTPSNIAALWQAQGGSIITKAPSGTTPNCKLPMKLSNMTPGSLVADMKWAKNAATSGRWHLAWDIWLQETPDQGEGFGNSSITHEIMIPMGNGGNYGKHPNGRNPGWYSHDTTIDGVVYHVYFAGDKYTFGGLNGKFTNEETGQPRTGWKFIVFQHDGENHPTDAQGNVHLDFAKFVAHMKTAKYNGVAMCRGTEYCTSAQVGIEAVYGVGDVTIYDFKVK
jgi:hypothetical protein